MDGETEAQRGLPCLQPHPQDIARLEPEPRAHRCQATHPVWAACVTAPLCSFFVSPGSRCPVHPRWPLRGDARVWRAGTKQMASGGGCLSHGGQPLTEGHEDLPCPWTGGSGSWFPKETSTGLSGQRPCAAVADPWVQAPGPRPAPFSVQNARQVPSPGAPVTPTTADVRPCFPSRALCVRWTPRKSGPPAVPGSCSSPQTTGFSV